MNRRGRAAGTRALLALVLVLSHLAGASPSLASEHGASPNPSPSPATDAKSQARVQGTLDGMTPSRSTRLELVLAEPGQAQLRVGARFEESNFWFEDLPLGNFYMLLDNQSVMVIPLTGAGEPLPIALNIQRNVQLIIAIRLTTEGQAIAEPPVVRALPRAEPTPRPIEAVNPFDFALAQASELTYQPGLFRGRSGGGGPSVLGLIVLAVIFTSALTLAIFTWYCTTRLPTLSRYRSRTKE